MDALPVTDAQARAMEESAKAIQEAIQTFRAAGGYLRNIFGTVPEDLIGYFGDDRLKVARAENIVRILKRSEDLNKERGTKPQAVSLSVGLPLLVAAADESRDELVELWARLLAAASDPAKSRNFRLAFIDIVKKLDPLDSMTLKLCAKFASNLRNVYNNANAVAAIRNEMQVTDDELSVSMRNLKNLGLMETTGIGDTQGPTALGRELLRMVGEAG